MKRGLPQGVRARVKGWLNLNNRFLMGPRYVLLLEGIERTGTIRGACRGTGMSYRTCLNRIRQMERVLKARVVVTSRGGEARGRAELTPLARRLIRLYRSWRAALERGSDRAFARLRRAT